MRSARTSLKRSVQLFAASLSVGLAVFSAVVLPSQVAGAATDTVSNCRGSASVTGSLPYVVGHAGNGDTITFAVSCPASSPIKLRRTIDITTDLTIDGPGESSLRISGHHAVSPLDISSGVTATISGITIEQGRNRSLPGQGGGITNDGTLMVSDCTLSGNMAFNPATPGNDGNGGAIENNGTLTVTDSTLSGNEANSPTGGNGGSGGGIDNEGMLTITNSTLSKDRAFEGGAIFNDDGSTMTVTNSTLTDNGNIGGQDGDVYDGGGIENYGTANLIGSSVSNSKGARRTFPSFGGGIENVGKLNLTDSNVSDDFANVAGGIENEGTLTVTNSTLSNDVASGAFGLGGGGISNDDATLTIVDTTLSGDNAGDGGGIENYGGIVTITDSTMSNNSAGTGGGLSNEDGGAVTASDNTLSGNLGCIGGGIANMDGPVTLNASTLSGDSVTDGCGGGTSNGVGAGVDNNDGTVSIAATIVANSGSGDDCVGAITDAGYNLDDDGSCGFSTAHSSQSAVGPDLGPLQDNGGPTETQAPAADSPVLNQIPLDTVVNSTTLCPGTDQRGVARPQGTECDIGAVELAAATESDTTPTARLSLTHGRRGNKPSGRH